MALQGTYWLTCLLSISGSYLMETAQFCFSEMPGCTREEMFCMPQIWALSISLLSEQEPGYVLHVMKRDDIKV